jgi:hypothetical protein
MKTGGARSKWPFPGKPGDEGATRGGTGGTGEVGARGEVGCVARPIPAPASTRFRFSASRDMRAAPAHLRLRLPPISAQLLDFAFGPSIGPTLVGNPSICAAPLRVTTPLPSFRASPVYARRPIFMRPDVLSRCAPLSSLPPVGAEIPLSFVRGLRHFYPASPSARAVGALPQHFAAQGPLHVHVSK